MLINTQTKEFSCAIFLIFELHTLASDFSGSVKGQTLPPYLILIYTLLWLCAENCTLVIYARLSTFWQLIIWTSGSSSSCRRRRSGSKKRKKRKEQKCYVRLYMCHWHDAAIWTLTDWKQISMSEEYRTQKKTVELLTMMDDGWL